MDPKKVSHPTRHLWVHFHHNEEKIKKTQGDLWKLLLDTYKVEGADELHMIKEEGDNPCAILKFKNGSFASKAVERVKEKNQGEMKREDSLAVSFFVHDQYTIGEDNYNDFINRLRDLFALREDGTIKYMVDVEVGKPATNPILREQQGRDRQPDRWIHIKLIAKKGAQESTTTLVIRDDNLYVRGFTGKDGQWFELCKNQVEDEDKMVEGDMSSKKEKKKEGDKLPDELPDEYKATKLETWGIMYDDLMKLNDLDQVKATLKSTKLGKAFAERAVRRLSSYCCTEAAAGGRVGDDSRTEGRKGSPIDDIPVRLGLAGLIVMICESARFSPLLDHFAGIADRSWNNGKGLIEDKICDWENMSVIWNWKNLSVAMRQWEGTGPWDKRCGAESFEDASRCVHLVLNVKDDNSEIRVSPHVKADVEILQVPANLDVAGIKGIKVIDETKKEQNNIKIVQENSRQENVDQENVDKKMALMVPKGISGYAWFDIELETSSGAADDSIKMRWDCRKDDRVEYQLVTRDITLSGADGRNHRMQFTYLVMSNAVQADVVIKLRLPARHQRGSSYTARGTIFAYISGINANNCPIVLFSNDENPIGFTLASSGGLTLTLKLDRSARVRMPQGKLLQIDIGNLHISKDGEELGLEWQYFVGPQEVRQNGSSRTISFDIKDTSAAIIPIRGSRRALEVKVNWKGVKAEKINAEVIVCKDIASRYYFTKCINDLRQKFADGCQDPIVAQDGTHHPVLKSQPSLPKGWIQVKLQAQASDGEESAMTTLAIRADKCYGVGFQNQSGVWYELCDKENDKALPARYNSVPLGAYYKDIGGVNYWELHSNGAACFATRAVRILSRYPDVKEEDYEIRLALAGIILMVCESAKLNSLYKYFLGTWDDNGSSTDEESFSNKQDELKNDIRNWEERSRALLYWRDHGYNNKKWGKHMKTLDLESLGGPEKALGIVHLVFNYWPRQIDMEYPIDDDATKFTEFIEDLRRRLADHEHREDVDSGRRRRPVLGRFRDEQPARWFHIKLQLPDGASTTLAVRDDIVYVRGFMNQSGKWYDLGFADPSSPDGILPTEYKAENLRWGNVYDNEILKVGSEELVLDPTRLGKDFAAMAVSRLSCYQHVQEQEAETRRALAGLSLMLIWSARFDTVCKHFAGGWNTGTPESSPFLRRMLDLTDISGWLRLSRALLHWKKAGYSDSEWHLEGTYEELGIKRGDNALDVVALVLPN